MTIYIVRDYEDIIAVFTDKVKADALVENSERYLWVEGRNIEQ